MGTRPLWKAIRRTREPFDAPHHVANSVLLCADVARPPIDVESIARILGVVVHKRGIGFAGSVDSTIDPPVIEVKADDALVRQRFTLAHELGHLLLHPIGVRRRDSTYARQGETMEQEANEFAASLLIPLWLLEPVVTRSKPNPRELAAIFQVSQNALVLQLRKLTL
jgi:Zn-dependent peptidase ImmA (M78 family)